MELIFSGWSPVHSRATYTWADGMWQVYAVVIKVLLDQTAFTLVCSVLTIAALTWAERKPLSQVPGRSQTTVVFDSMCRWQSQALTFCRLRSSLWPLLKANWKAHHMLPVISYHVICVCHEIELPSLRENYSPQCIVSPRYGGLQVWGPTMCVVYALVEEDLRPLVSV